MRHVMLNNIWRCSSFHIVGTTVFEEFANDPAVQEESVSFFKFTGLELSGVFKSEVWSIFVASLDSICFGLAVYRKHSILKLWKKNKLY